MRIIRWYQCATAEKLVRYYAQVGLDDGGRIEVGSREPLDDTAWLALAEKITAPEPEAEPVVEIECEDGSYA